MLNNLKVLKRDGLKQPFDKQRLFIVVQKAADAANQKIENLEDLVGKILAKFEGKEEVSVEDIQGSVEHTLMVSKYKETAKKYIEYRKSRDIAREQKSRLFKAVEGIVSQKDKTLLYENANLDSKTLTSQRTLIAGELSKDIARSVIPNYIYEAHVSGDIHWHDLTFSPALPYVNCCLVDYRGMLKNGFTLGGANIQAPKSIGVATAVVAQIIAQVSSQNYGGTSIADIDQGLAPYVKMSYDKHVKNAEKFGVNSVDEYAKTLTEKETYDAFQALEYEINSLFNSHAQSPFTTVSFGMGMSWEERLIQQCILKVRLEGLGEKKITAVFPKLIFFIGKGLNKNKEDVNYDIKLLALKCASKRLYPDIESVENIKKITGSSTPVTSMG